MITDFADNRTQFITLRLADRHGDLLLRAIDDLRRAMRQTIAQHPLRIDAMVVLPAVLHMIWTLPRGDPDPGASIQLLKSAFLPAMPPRPWRDPCPNNHRDRHIWHPGHEHHIITDAADFIRHRAFIHLSPVHADLCAHPGAWRHSSLHRDRHP